MKINSLAVQGFRSFTAQQELDFTRLRAGLYHLAGRNEVEPTLEGNGAGKSSLLEAVCWGLYGRTSRNLRAGVVKNWGSKEKCAVILNVQTAAGEVGVFRVWNPNTLEVTVNGSAPRPVDQRELDALLGVGPEAFLFSIYFAQFAPAFIDLRPAEQMAVYSAVLGLELWASAADAASKRGRDLETTVQQHRERLAVLEGQLIELRAAYEKLGGEERTWLEGMVVREKQLVGVAEEVRKNLKNAEKSRDKATAGAEKFRALRVEVETCARAVALAESETRRLEREVSALSGKERITKCPTCGGPITTAHLKVERKRQEAKLLEARTASDQVLTAHDAKMKEMMKHRDAEVVMLDAEKQVAALSSDLRNAEESLTRLGAEENPYDRKRAEGQERIKTLQERVAKGKAEVERTEAERGAAQFWAKGFKELRLSLIEESLAQLSIEANAALVELGLRDWTLRFDVERETKSGGVSRGFTVAVEAPHVREPVPWEAWSGGESQRLRLATALGFSELICSRMGLQPNVELFDEPSTWLSEAGIHDLLETLATRAQRRGKVVLLADHRALDFGGFSGVLEVVKTAVGSRVSISV